MAPVLAQPSEPPAPRFELGLAAASTAPRVDFGTDLEGIAAMASEATETAEIRLSEVRAEAWALAEEGDDTGVDMKPETGKRWVRWLKKRWYVPVLAAVALGVALDSDDNDASGEED